MFKFKLQALLKFKKRVEDNKQKELALKKQELFEQKKCLSEFDSKKKEHEKDLSLRKSDKITVNELLNYSNYFEKLNILCENQGEKIFKAEKEVEIRRNELLLAMRERKTIEILRAKEYTKYTDGIKKNEQKVIDEIVVTRYEKYYS